MATVVVSASSHQRYPSPLRYPGGKGKIANFVKLVFLANDLVGSEYAEPYAGGAAVGLSLLYEEYASHIHINDLDRAVYAFWRAVLEDSEALCQRIRDTRVTVDEWSRQKAVQDDPSPDPLDLAFSTFFLNRTNRSGILRGGVIGGRSQGGEWLLDARYNVSNLIRRIEKVARFRSRITVTQLDAADYIERILPELSEEMLVYFDPPYFTKGSDLYTNFYEPADHAEIARLIPRVEQRWIVSYDAADEILDLYSDHTSLGYTLSYSASQRYRGGEVMFFSPGLVPPSVLSPANIAGSVVESARRVGRDGWKNLRLTSAP